MMGQHEQPSPRAPAVRAGQLDFWKFWVGQTISNLGSSFTLFALPLLIFALTHSAVALAIGSAAAGLPYPLFGLLLGAWVDRVNRKRMMILADLGRAALIASIPVLALASHLTVWWIYCVSFLSTSLSIAFDSGEFAAIPSLVSQDDLITANGRIQASYSAASIVGPLLAGALVAVVPLPSLLFIDASSFVVSALSLGLIGRPFNAAGARRATQNIVRDVGEGLRYVWRHPVLRNISIMMALVNFVATTRYAQLVLFASEHLHANKSEIGWLYSGGSLGVVVLSLLAGPLRKRWSFGVVALGALMLIGLLTIVSALIPWYWPDLAVWSVISGLAILFNINTASLRQAIVPNELLGRILSIASVIAWSANPLGALAGGFLIQATGNVVLVYAIVGVITFLIPLAFTFSPLGHAERYLPAAAEARSV